MPATLSRRAPRRFWGWGNADSVLDAREQAITQLLLARIGTAQAERPEPRIEEFSMPAPRISAPPALAAQFSASPLDRLNHSSGKSYADCARMWLRQAPTPPDWVAFPEDEQAVIDILDWAQAQNVAVIPYGGGSSVCGGVEAAVGDGYAGTVSLDLERLNRVLEVDPLSRAARIQAGALGPELAAQLKPHGLALRHFPQSFEFSSLGGWIATRAGGHYATQYTHIDDFVESTRLVTPCGVIQTRRLPGSGAGPAPDRLVLGSEGSLGVLTEAWMRLQLPPRFRASASVQFSDYPRAVECVRALAQSGLNPSNCRLLDPQETLFAGVGTGSASMLVLGFESADHPLQAWMGRALELVGEFGGSYDQAAVARSMAEEHSDVHRQGAAGAWRDAFLRMPYWRDPGVGLGVIMDTVESAVTWDRFAEFYAGVKRDIARAIKQATGQDVLLSCRMTHLYPDGPAPYFTFATRSADGSVASALAAWREIKQAANEALVAHGGTITHHHAVGRDHRSGYEREVDPLFRRMLAAAKHTVDPQGILNPGVLFDPCGRALGLTGALLP
ncbi:FAD-binding oxidoreductase [Pseudomonas sp. N040]|uniref:FAD-binding oxidoreductase n=1 Tax=Pseudomonas sp. N040 TaxID=2785325 RepID=UPI0018A2AD49|nr:FAD-binding oxidoreductase [Pseudomonas sp. N040]MBF7729450.1 FAD-binding oxidoreductase [Pseudomonas sp. N040]MBW7013090.1 FAD-binding oxidoreductase [Pseudomonas sp. N040]